MNLYSKDTFLILLRFFVISVCLTFQISIFAQQSASLYVGQETYFPAPNPPNPNGQISHAICQSLHSSVYVWQDYGEAGCKALVTSYFEDTAVIECEVYWYAVIDGKQYGVYHFTTYFEITCKPVNITLSPSSMKLDVGESRKLDYSLSPIISPSPTVSMYSSNNDIATVSNGYVKAVGAGDCEIEVINSAGPNAYCHVHVNKVDPLSVNLPATDPVYIGQKLTIVPVLSPNNAQTTYSWSSSNPNVATINSNGELTGKSVGTTTITVTTANNLSASCDVEVYKPVPASIEFTKPSLRLAVGANEMLTYNVSPSYAIYDVFWESDKPDIVSVSNGRIEAKKQGKANIIVKTDNDMKATCEVTVAPEPTDISLIPENLELGVGQTKQLTYSFIPEDAATLQLTWKSSNPEVAIVNENGEVSTKAEGTTRISVTTANGVTGSCDVTVRPGPSSISISESSLSLHIGDEVSLSYNVLPTNAIYTIAWSSSSPDIVTVSNEGKVNAKNVGSAKITLSTDNGLSSSCDVSVYPAPTDISLDKTSLNLLVGQSDSLIYTVLPTNALYTVSWDSNAPKVATVKVGRIEARSGGTAYITVTTDNGKKDSCKVVVTPEPSGVFIEPKELELFWGRSKQLTYSFVPAKAKSLSLTWKSSDTKIASVDSLGMVTALRPGKATITATTRGGIVGRCELTVPIPHYQLFVWTKAGIKTGYLSTDEPEFNVEDDIVHFRTKNLTLNIHRDTLDKFTLEPVLPEHPKAIILSEDMQLGLGMTVQLNYSITPEDAQTRLTWFNDNPEVVRITQDGVITALNVGEANLMLQTSNGLHAKTHITVPEPHLRFYVWMRDGEVHSYDLEERPEVTLGKPTFTLTTTNQTVEYVAANILRFTLEDETVVDVTTDIAMPEKEDNIKFKTGILHITGCQQNSPVRIYDPTGKLLQSAQTDGDGNLSLSLSSLRAGVYIIRTEKTTIKIQKR